MGPIGARRGDKPPVWNGGGCYLTGLFGLLLKLMLGFVRAGRR